MGREPGAIRPEGAQEVRKAASAFNRMQERIRHFVAQRTAMLAGVSHDLRTPLTRLRLRAEGLDDATQQAQFRQAAVEGFERRGIAGDILVLQRFNQGFLLDDPASGGIN